MKRNVTMEQLLDLIEGRLPDEQVTRLEQMMAPADTAELAKLKPFYQRVTTVELVAPPDEAHDVVVEQLNAVIKPKERPTLWQRITAQLQRDSADTIGGLVPVGARDVHFDNSKAHDLLFTTDPVHIVLNVAPDGNTFILDGQLFPQAETVSDQFTIQLVQNDNEVALTHSDDLGEFSLPPVPAGLYELVLCGDEIEVVIPSIALT